MATVDVMPLLPPPRARNYRREHTQKLKRAAADRVKLIESLGGKCVEPGCGETDAGKLEFDHIEPRNWVTRNHNQLTRIRFYQREERLGLIELRCRSCNASKGAPAPAEGADGCDW